MLSRQAGDSNEWKLDRVTIGLSPARNAQRCVTRHGSYTRERNTPLNRHIQLITHSLEKHTTRLIDACKSTGINGVMTRALTRGGTDHFTENSTKTKKQPQHMSHRNVHPQPKKNIFHPATLNYDFDLQIWPTRYSIDCSTWTTKVVGKNVKCKCLTCAALKNWHSTSRK